MLGDPQSELRSQGWRGSCRFSLARLYPIAQQIADILGYPIDSGVPNVGTSAFAHKGGSTPGLARLEGFYEHVNPSAGGQLARMLFE